MVVSSRTLSARGTRCGCSAPSGSIRNCPDRIVIGVVAVGALNGTYLAPYGTLQGFPAMPRSKTFTLQDGTKVYAPRKERPEAEPKASPIIFKVILSKSLYSVKIYLIGWQWHAIGSDVIPRGRSNSGQTCFYS